MNFYVSSHVSACKQATGKTNEREREKIEELAREKRQAVLVTFIG